MTEILENFVQIDETHETDMNPYLVIIFVT